MATIPCSSMAFMLYPWQKCILCRPRPTYSPGEYTVAGRTSRKTTSGSLRVMVSRATQLLLLASRSHIFLIMDIQYHVAVFDWTYTLYPEGWHSILPGYCFWADVSAVPSVAHCSAVCGWLPVNIWCDANNGFHWDGPIPLPHSLKAEVSVHILSHVGFHG